MADACNAIKLRTQTTAIPSLEALDIDPIFISCLIRCHEMNLHALRSLCSFEATSAVDTGEDETSLSHVRFLTIRQCMCLFQFVCQAHAGRQTCTLTDIDENFLFLSPH